jgi:hypothetical protein
MNLCRRCFREAANAIGFVKVRTAGGRQDAGNGGRRQATLRLLLAATTPTTVPASPCSPLSAPSSPSPRHPAPAVPVSDGAPARCRYYVWAGGRSMSD